MPDLPDGYWPNVEIGTVANYTYDATNDITTHGTVDPIVSASISTLPSGVGELSATALSVVVGNDQHTYITAVLSGATVAGRTYIHNVSFTTASGLTLPVLIGQVCDPVLAQVPLSPSPTPGFGPPVLWP